MAAKKEEDLKLEVRLLQNGDELVEQTEKKLKSTLRENLLTILIFVGVTFGVVIALLLRQSRSEKWTEREIMYINFIGDIFLRMLKCLSIPLIVASLVSTISTLDVSLSGKIAARAVGMYIVFMTIGVVWGLILVTMVKPGQLEANYAVAERTNLRNVTTIDTMLDLVRNMFPPNIIEACTTQVVTLLVPPTNYTDDLYKWKITYEKLDDVNILGLVIFSTGLGVILARTGSTAKCLTDMFQAFANAMMGLTKWVIWLSPVGVMSLITSKMLAVDSLEELVGQLGKYFLTVVGGLVIQVFVILPAIYFGATRKSPVAFIVNMGQAIITAFGTASSAATLPISIQCLEENNQISPGTTRFALPIALVLNKQGTVMYMMIAVIFIAQLRNVVLSLGQMVAVGITGTVACMSAPSVPQSGLVVMVMVLNTVALPAEDISIIVAIDWLLDRCRTMTNVIGTAIGAAIVDASIDNNKRHLNS